MQIYSKCLVCALDNFLDLLERTEIEADTKERHIRNFLSYLSKIDFKLPPPIIARHMQTKMRQLLGQVDLYKRDKQAQNRAMLEIESVLRKKISEHDDSVLAAIHLAISGNVIDLGTRHGLEMEKTIDEALDCVLAVDATNEMIEQIKKAKKILYLADNAGEIVLDKLLIEEMIKSSIISAEQLTLVVRGAPILNDVTLEDLTEVGIPTSIRIIDNGDCTPGTWLPDTSDEFNQVWAEADVVISKGQGNYETLSLVDGKQIFFLLIAKCEIVASELGVRLGDFICKKTS